MDRNYNEVFEITKKRRGIKMFFITLVILIMILSIIYLVIKVTQNSGNKKYDVFVNSKDFFAVTLAQNSNKSDLQSLYGNATAIGASGYIWENANDCYLLALIYPNEDMAKSVVASNSSDNFTLDILRVTAQQIAFNLEDFEKNDIEEVCSTANYIYDMANILYELTISVQIGNISAIACASTINNHKGDMLAKMSNIEYMLTSKNNENIVSLHQKCIKLNNILEKMVNELLTNTNMTTVMKYNFCEYIYELCKN